MKKNILVIWTWYHARRIYIPYLMENKNNFNNIIWFDLLSQKWIISRYLNKKWYLDFKIEYLDDKSKDKDLKVKSIIESILQEFDINMVIISTEPLYHNIYANIILENNISIMLDKPITLEKNVINTPLIADKILFDYNIICSNFFKKAKNINWLQFDIMAQRRYHKWYRIALEKIKEIFKLINCPITSINSFHNDWQWRFPDEIIDQNYHPYNQWYWKLWHSWFHTIDIVNWFIKNTSLWNKKIIEAEVISFANFPNDLISQFNYDDYENLFPWFKEQSKYSQKEFLKESVNFWDVDSSSIIKYKNKDWIQTIASINLWHNWFWQRSWLTAKWRDLYKWNWRIRQEFLMIEQWPFQSILIETFQSKEINKENKNLYSFWGEQHFDIHVFRNSELFKNFKSYEKITSKDLYKNIWEGYSRWHNEEARRKGVKYFINNIENKKSYKKSLSNILDHDFSTKIFVSICKSIANQKVWKNPIINIKL